MKKFRIPDSPIEYPSGSFLKTEKGYFFVVNEEKRFYAIHKRVVDSWNPHRIILTSESAVKNNRIAARLKFRNGSLIYNYSDAKIYLISDGKRRHIQSPDVLGYLNASDKDIVRVSTEEINLHPEGVPLS